MESIIQTAPLSKEKTNDILITDIHLSQLSHFSMQTRKSYLLYRVVYSLNFPLIFRFRDEMLYYSLHYICNYEIEIKIYKR